MRTVLILAAVALVAIGGLYFGKSHNITTRRTVADSVRSLRGLFGIV